MLKLFRKDSLTPQTERIYKVPLCIQDTIPIYRITGESDKQRRRKKEDSSV